MPVSVPTSAPACLLAWESHVDQHDRPTAVQAWDPRVVADQQSQRGGCLRALPGGEAAPGSWHWRSADAGRAKVIGLPRQVN